MTRGDVTHMATPCCTKHTRHQRPTQGLYGGPTLGIPLSPPNAHPPAVHHGCTAGPESEPLSGRQRNHGWLTERSTSTTAVAILIFPEIFWVIQSGLGASLGGAVVAGQWELGYTAGQPICWGKGQPRWMLTRRLNSKMTQSTACRNLLQSKVRPLYEAGVVNGRRPENGDQLGTFQTVRGALFEEDKALHFFF